MYVLVSGQINEFVTKHNWRKRGTREHVNEERFAIMQAGRIEKLWVPTTLKRKKEVQKFAIQENQRAYYFFFYADENRVS